jgi:cytidylate kinase
MKHDEHIIIAIDGPAGAGKSTVAKQVARRLSLLYIDSGAMYRAVAWKALKEKIEMKDEKAMTELAGNMNIELGSADEGTRVFVDGEDVTPSVRTPEVTDASSKLATIGAVRAILVKQQQAMARASGVVMEGRDIGTVVFPETPFKFFLDASPRERANRRKKDFEQAGYKVELAQMERDVVERDRRDTTRSVAPLLKVEGAMLIDTTGMTIEQVVQAISNHVETLLSERAEKE